MGKARVGQFKAEFYVRAHQCAKEGLSNSEIAVALGVDDRTFRKWMRKKEAFSKSVTSGRSRQARENGSKRGGQTFEEFCYYRLPQRMKEVWDKINKIDADDAADAFEKLQEVFAGQGKKVRQYLYFHALIASNFNQAEACRKTGLSPKLVDIWKTQDREFAELITVRLTEARKDFCESCLMGLVSQGDVSATIFVNRTLNRDRGYDPKISVEHSGTIKHAHVDVNKLLDKMSAPAKREMLDAMRMQQREAVAAITTSHRVEVEDNE